MSEGCGCQLYSEAEIGEAVDGSLPPEERRRLTEHLRECPDCRAAYEEILLLHEAFARWEAPEPPGDLAGAVMARVRAERRGRKRRVLPRAAAVAACLTLILAGARLLPPDSAHDASIAHQGGAGLPAEDEGAALSDSAASGGTPEAKPSLRMAEPSGDEQAMTEGAVAYFEETAKTDAYTDTDEASALPTLSSSDPELLRWMSANIPEEGRRSGGEDAAVTVWLITGEEYEALSVHIGKVSMAYEMDWGAAIAAQALNGSGQEAGAEAVIRVVYRQEAGD